MSDLVKPGRPTLGADYWERLHWTLWQCYGAHPDDAEARRAHDLIKDLRAAKRDLVFPGYLVSAMPLWRRVLLRWLLPNIEALR